MISKYFQMITLQRRGAFVRLYPGRNMNISYAPLNVFRLTCKIKGLVKLVEITSKSLSFQKCKFRKIR